MIGVLLTKKPFILLGALLISGLVFFMIQRTHADALSLDSLRTALPGQVNGWAVKPEDRFFDKDSIFSYINGAGEVYRAYNMQMCLSRRYTTPDGPAIVLDIFDMGSSEDAFGIFTHDLDGEELDLGQGALFRPGWLSFWKDRFFVSIYMEEETSAAEKTVRELGKIVSSLIRSHGPMPRILLRLPSDGLQHKSVRYLHHHIVLNYHFYLSDKNILNIGPHTDAALARYQRGQAHARLLLVMYPNEGKAAKALSNFLRHYLPDADPKGLVLLENGKWSAAAVKGRLLATVFESDSRQLAEDLLKKTMETASQN